MIEFFDAVWRSIGGYGEFRFIKNGTVEQRFFDLPLDDGLLGLTSDWDHDGWDCYFGVLPRIRHGGKASDCSPVTRTLWADVDAKRTGGKGVALHTILSLIEQPNIIVDSGHGYHAYWLLERDLDMVDASLIMRGLARELHGDAVHDAPRVLRVPGTRNHKDADPPRVRVLRLDLTRYWRGSDFDTYVTVERSWPTVTRREGERVEDVPVWLEDLITGGAPRGARSEAAFKVCLWLLRYGWSDAQIRLVFKSHPNGIGEKYAEAGDRWLERTIAAASRDA